MAIPVSSQVQLKDPLALVVGSDGHGRKGPSPDWTAVDLNRQISKEDVPDHLAVFERHKRGDDCNAAAAILNQFGLVARAERRLTEGRDCRAMRGTFFNNDDHGETVPALTLQRTPHGRLEAAILIAESPLKIGDAR